MMKKFSSLIFSSLFVSSLLQSASLEKMIGEVDENPVVLFQTENYGNAEATSSSISTSSSSSGSSCSCSSSINTAKRQMKEAIEDYVNDSVGALDDLIAQLQKNHKELRNRTNNIENEEYFMDLENKVSLVKNSTAIKKHKLLGYENMLFFSKNGIIEKEDRLRNIVQLIKTLESVENSMIAKKGE
jgi:hypothetical protein